MVEFINDIILVLRWSNLFKTWEEEEDGDILVDKILISLLW